MTDREVVGAGLCIMWAVVMMAIAPLTVSRLGWWRGSLVVWFYVAATVLAVWVAEKRGAGN